jgi:hypothetical protein
MSTPWMMTWVEVMGVASHGRLVAVQVKVHPTKIPISPRQFAKLAPVIVATAALSTETLNVVAAQDNPEFHAGMENPDWPKSIRPSVVPTGAQLADDATDGNTNAHDANTTPKSITLFLETIFTIARHS